MCDARPHRALVLRDAALLALASWHDLPAVQRPEGDDPLEVDAVASTEVSLLAVPKNLHGFDRHRVRSDESSVAHLVSLPPMDGARWQNIRAFAGAGREVGYGCPAAAAHRHGAKQPRAQPSALRGPAVAPRLGPPAFGGGASLGMSPRRGVRTVPRACPGGSTGVGCVALGRKTR